MGTKKRSTKKALPVLSTRIAAALFTKVQHRVLGVLFGNPDRSFYTNEIIFLADTGTGAVQRELARLEAAGLVTVTRVGKQKHYQANAAAPVFEELCSLVLKTSSLADLLRGALSPLAERINAAFVYGSVAKGQDTTTSDINLMLVSNTLTVVDIFAALEEIASRLGRPVNPTVYSQEEFEKRIEKDKAFAKQLLAQPKL